MLSRLLSRSPDLQRLVSEGYDVEIRGNNLVLNDIPYVKADRTIGYGILASTLNLQGESTRAPDDHTALWVGEIPCDSEGRPLDNLVIPNQQQAIDVELTSNHKFSRRPQPAGKYLDYHQKLTTYVAWVSGPAMTLDSSVSARPRRPLRPDPGVSVFEYMETASARAGIGQTNAKLATGPVAIVGLGGTGSYVLDLVAKTPVQEIHLFDADFFMTHNAFRSPGAPTLAELESAPKKVAWFHSIYSKMRRGIVPHESNIDSTSVGELKGMDYVFLCLEGGPDKKAALDFLVRERIPFVDVGAGLVPAGESLTGSLRVTRATREKSDHVGARIPLAGAGPDEYDRNIQVADINALNAALAVIRWKKDHGFYSDFRNEHSMVYSIATNTIVNDEAPDEGPSVPP